MMSTNTHVALAPNVGTRVIGERICFIDQRTSAAWVYNSTGRRIWTDLQSGSSVMEIAIALSEHYGISMYQAQADVDSFVLNLSNRKLLSTPAVSDSTNRLETPHNYNGVLSEVAIDAQVPAIAVIDLLVPCNLRCRHCYLDFSKTDIVPIDTIFRYFAELAAVGCPEVILTGGEIFLRRDLLDIIGEAERLGFLITLLTNGQLINESMAQMLSQRLLKRVQISMYGSTVEIHERITRKDGSFNKSVNAAKLMMAHGIPVHFSYFIQQDNFDDAFCFGDFAVSLGATYSFDSKMVPNRNGSIEPLSHGVTVLQQAEVYKHGLMSHFAETTCSAAVAVCRITAAGDVYPCELMNTISIGNLNRQSFQEVWDSTRRRDIRTAIVGFKPHRCGSCGHTDSCSPCAALRGIGQPDDLDMPVSEACMLTTSHLVSISPTHLAVEQIQNSCLSDASLSARTTQLVQIVTARLPQLA